MKKTLITSILIVLHLSIIYSQTQTVSLEPQKDNSIYSDGPDDTSNGSGDHLFAGVTNNGVLHRALIQFDLSSIPAETLIDSAMLTLEISKSNSGTQQGSIHKLLSDWGEGASNAASNEGQGAEALEGDATWNFTFLNAQSWNNPGGDFVSDASASVSIGNTGSVIFRSNKLLEDINSWLSTPESNFGLVIIVDESGGKSSKRFYSRENSNEEKRPSLTLYYEEPSTTVQSEEKTKAGMRIYSDLGRKTIQLRSDYETASYAIKIYSILGALLTEKTVELKRGLNIIDHNIDQAGLYIITVSNAEHQFSEKLLLK